MELCNRTCCKVGPEGQLLKSVHFLVCKIESLPQLPALPQLQLPPSAFKTLSPLIDSLLNTSVHYFGHFCRFGCRGVQVFENGVFGYFDTLFHPQTAFQGTLEAASAGKDNIWGYAESKLAGKLIIW